MATDLTAGTLAVAPGIPGDNLFVVKSPLITVPATAVTGSVYQALKVKAGWLVHGTRVKMVTAGVGGTIQADIGYGESTYNDIFDAAIDLEAAADTVYLSTPSDTAPAAGGHYFATADTIDVYMHNVTSAITTVPTFYIYALVEELRI